MVAATQNHRIVTSALKKYVVCDIEKEIDTKN